MFDKFFAKIVKKNYNFEERLENFKTDIVKQMKKVPGLQPGHRDIILSIIKDEEERNF